MFSDIDFTHCPDENVGAVKDAITKGESVSWIIGRNALPFIVGNYRALAARGVLEQPWLETYLHSSHFAGYGIETIKAIFDHCDKERMQELRPLPPIGRLSEGQRFTVFRGCAGPVHTMGMSWTPSLDKAIWYAAQHIEYRGLTNPAVYVATVDRSEIYCCFDHNEIEYIVYPKNAWRVDVTADEYRLNRPR